MTNTENKTSFELFAAACRYNSGNHFLDSGDYYGRHHEKPPIAEDCNSVSVEVWRGNDISATIETAHFLAAHYEIDHEIQARFENWQADEDGDWFSLAQSFCEANGLVSRARDNVYNGENDLSQVYIWEVWTDKDDESPEWIYSENPLVTIHVHTGCDVRGGYSRPLFCRPRGEYAVAVDHVASYRITESHFETDGLDDRWQAGYSSYPAGQVRDDVERIFTHTVRDGSFIAKLKSGEVVRIAAEMPFCY